MNLEQYTENALRGIQTCLNEMIEDSVDRAYIWQDDSTPDGWLWSHKLVEGVPETNIMTWPGDNPERIFQTVKKLQIADHIVTLAGQGDANAQAFLAALQPS